MSLITIIGAGPGISMGTALRFGKEGFTVALLARNEQKLKDLTAELQNKHINAFYVTCNSADEQSLKTALDTVTERGGESDVVLYNAAGVSVADMLEQDWNTIKSALDISIGGAFHLIKLTLPQYLKANKGKLFFTGGGFALSGDPQWTALSIGKAGLRNLLQAAHKKVTKTNVHIAHLVVCGYVNNADPKYNPEAIAEQYWKLYKQEPGNFEFEIIY